MSFELPTAFWKSFAQENWDKQPRVFKQVFDGRLIAPKEELFRLVTDATDRYAQVAGDWMKRPPFRMALDRGGLMVPLPYLPRREDGSFESWAQRMYREVPGRSFLFHMLSLQGESSLLFERYREFTGGLLEQIGLPPMRVDSDIFIGDYQQTPFGVHKDVSGNFACIIAGRKRMLLWPYETLLPYVGGSLDPSGLDFALQVRGLEEIREPPIVLEGEPGDVFYWPGRFWHCAQGTGSLSITNNFAVYLNSTPLFEGFPDFIFEKLQPVFEQNNPFTPYAPARLQELAGAMPEAMHTAARRVKEELRELVEGGLEREVELTWLRFVSGGGFTRVPAPDRGGVLDEAQAMKLAPRAGLVWRKLSTGQLAFAANGHATCLPESRGLVEVLTRLSGGGAHRVGALLEEAVEERQGGTVVWSRERMREVLTALVAKRALVRA